MQEKWTAHFCFIIDTLMESAPRFQPATPEHALQVPDDVLQTQDELLTCPNCGRVYWRGSHYKRMRKKLESWQDNPARFEEIFLPS